MEKISSKKRVQLCFDRKPLDRVPFWYGADPETTNNLAKYFKVKTEEEVLRCMNIDFRTVRPLYIGPEMKKYPDGSSDTVWGVKRGGHYYGQALTHPLEHCNTVKDVESFSWPEDKLWDCENIVEKSGVDYKNYSIISGAWSPFFHDVADMFDMEAMFMKMVDTPEVVECAIDRCCDIYLKLSERMFKSEAGKMDMFFVGNDFGTQRGLIVSPEMWRVFFKKSLKKFCDLGKKYKLKMAIHTCGSIYDIIPDLIEIGFDAINPVQQNVANMEPDRLKKEFGRDTVFFGGIDVHHILNNGTVKDVILETKRIADILGESGGYILAPAHDYLLPEIPSVNIAAMYAAGEISK